MVRERLLLLLLEGCERIFRFEGVVPEWLLLLLENHWLLLVQGYWLLHRICTRSHERVTQEPPHASRCGVSNDQKWRHACGFL